MFYLVNQRKKLNFAKNIHILLELPILTDGKKNKET